MTDLTGLIYVTGPTGDKDLVYVQVSAKELAVTKIQQIITIKHLYLPWAFRL